MIKMRCHTNLDLLEEIWPKELPERLIVGDFVESQVMHKGGNLILKVVSITWKDYMSEWIMDIELHDRFSRSIREFYEWYAPFVGKDVSSFI